MKLIVSINIMAKCEVTIDPEKGFLLQSSKPNVFGLTNYEGNQPTGIDAAVMDRAIQLFLLKEIAKQPYPQEITNAIPGLTDAKANA